MIHLFGIRHHGPGSAKRLRRALKALQPDCILIELPPDAEKALGYVARDTLRPPVALLLFDPKNFDRASYLPFAEFSPEWQALRYGAKYEVPVWPIDLPLSQLFMLRQPPPGSQLELRGDGAEEARRIQYDPLGFIAELAGYRDSERWWEVTFEQEAGEEAVFEAILNMIRTLRAELAREETTETLLREAHMRKMIRKARKEGFQRIAVVCGAWHAPALADVDAFKSTADNKQLRGLKTTKTEVTWIPWSFDRLARASGYGAGVVSPAWYDLLFRSRAEVTIRWMSRAAHLLRRKGLDASSAHVLEAVRLAEALAGLRRRSVPGLDELEEAALTVLCHGRQQLLAPIREQLIVGVQLGKVPPDIPAVPLQKDLEKKIRSARLTRESQTTELIRKSLDLRKPANLRASRLLHRLQILHIPWGRQRKGSQWRTGSFSEEWSLRWKPEFLIRIIERGALGNTVQQAATTALLQAAREGDTLPRLSELVGSALHSDLGEAIDALIIRMRELAALTKDVVHLMEALPPMVHIVVYGDTRQTDTEAVEQLVDEIIPRICIGLPGATLQIEAAVAEALFQHVLNTHHAVNLLDRSEHGDAWLQALEQLLLRPGVHELICGGALRLLFEKSRLPLETTRRQLHFTLSRSTPPQEAARWLEGFLHGSGLLLIHNPELWLLLDEWIGKLTPEEFQETLPVLRRIFSNYLPAERRKMLDMARRDSAALPTQAAEITWNQQRRAAILPTLHSLLGSGSPEEEPPVDI